MSIYDETIVDNVLLAFASNDYILPVCGSNPIKVYTGCCGYSLDLAFTLGYASWSEEPVDTPDLANSPKSSNNQYYCALYPAEEYSLYNYTFIYALAGGYCTINNIRCFSNGTVNIYSDYDCQGDYYSASLASSQLLQTGIVGNVTGEFIKVTNGTTVYTWVAYSPEIIEVTSTYAYMIPFEYVAYTLLFTAFFLSFIRAVYFTILYIKYKKPMDLYKSINTTLWFIWVILAYFYYTAIYSSNQGWMILGQFQNFIFNAATYMTAAGTLMFFLEIQRKEKYYTAGLSVLFIYQIIFGGSNYLAYLKFYPATTVFFAYWSYLNPVWIVSVYLFDTIPQIILVHNLVKSRKGATLFFKEFQFFLAENKIYLVLVILHFCNMICFYLIMYLTSYTDILGSDRVALAMCGPLTMVDTLHSILNSLVLGELRMILQARIKKVTVPSLSQRFYLLFERQKTSNSSQQMSNNRSHTKKAEQSISRLHVQ
ncbi:hypothetical protein HDV01_006681 [Terramyces sp. JEL0728]|nr:hypothetical protein HDV01_006681 [Terramyces sp. JEL0728]